MGTLQEIAQLGQSIWLDGMTRGLLTSGKLQWYIQAGLRGVSFNPFVWQQSLTQTTDYDQQINQLIDAGKSLQEMWEALLLQDIQQAADMLLSVHSRTEGAHGYLSVIGLGNTLAEIQRWQQMINRPNVQFQVPTTPEGVHLIQQLTGEGVASYAYPLFSLTQYQVVLEAYVQGLEKRIAAREDVKSMRSTAAFVIQPLDEKIGSLATLDSNIGIAMAKQVYAYFQDFLDSDRWQKLAEQGAHPQRLAWQHTRPHDLASEPTFYLDHLIGAQTNHVLHPLTLEAFLKQSKPEPAAATLEESLSDAQAQIEQLSAQGIQFDEVTNAMQQTLIQQYSRLQEGILEAIEHKRDEFLLQQRAVTAARK